MTRLLLLICLVISFNPDVKATAQLPELLVISNDTFAMTSTPLQNHPRYRQIHNKNTLENSQRAILLHTTVCGYMDT